jgi:hypothetical protein
MLLCTTGLLEHCKCLPSCSNKKVCFKYRTYKMFKVLFGIYRFW